MSGAMPTVLLAEDDSNDVLLLQRAIRKANLAVSLQIVGDGAAAIEYLAGEGAYADRGRYPLPTLMLLDLKLPRRSGHEVLAWLRQQPGLGRLPVVVLTSSRQPPDIDRAYDLYVNSYLVKPVAPADLHRMVETLGLYWLTLNEHPDI